MKLHYIGFAQIGNLFGPAVGFGEYTPVLPAGHYKVGFNQRTDELELTKFDPKMDEILNLGCKEFNATLDSVSNFLKPETAVEFKKHGFLLKRSYLFYGLPGTGKSVLSSKVADLTVKSKDAIVLYPDSFEALQRVLEVLDETDKDRFKTIVLEEFDSLIGDYHESGWTTLLDGQFQSDNRLLLATTNYVQNISRRLLRPGRFSTLVNIPVLTSEERCLFLESKGLSGKQAANIVEKTTDFTVDDLKEVVQSTLVSKREVQITIDAIRANKNLGKADEEC